MRKGTKGEAARYIAAPAETVYDLVADVTRMSEWSPECVRCEWIGGATGPEVGVRFKGSSKRGWVRWSTRPRVITADRPRAFGFVTTHRGHHETMWTYRFTPQGHGTTVTETFEMLADLPWYLRLVERLAMGVKDRKSDLQAGMAETLRRLGATAEAEHLAAPPLQAKEA